MKKITKIFIPLNKKYFEIPFNKEYKKFISNDLVFINLPDMGKNIAKIKEVEKSKNNEKNFKELSILHKASEDDLTTWEKRKEEAKNDFKAFKEKIIKNKLNMIPIFGNISFNGDFFYAGFSANERIDFRSLVKDVSVKIKKKVFFEQIGARDRTKIIGDLGKCGQRICCKRFLDFLPSVTMHSARLQNLRSKQLENLTGICGKLKCCLNFESELYSKNIKKLPKIGEKVFVKGRVGKVLGLDILNQNIKIYFEKEN